VVRKALLNICANQKLHTVNQELIRKTYCIWNLEKVWCFCKLI